MSKQGCRHKKGWLARASGASLCAGLAIAGGISTVPDAHAADVPPIIYCQGRPVTSLAFAAPTLETGTALQVGAVYRYTNVAPGVDALVEITDFVFNGSLNEIDNDTTNNLPTDPAVQARLRNYFQPELQTDGNAAVDFEFIFVQSGTNDTPANRVELDLAVSSIDVDGNGNSPTNGTMREFVEHDFGSVGFVLNSTTNLDRNATTGLRIGDRYEVRDFQFAPGIDPTAEDNIVTTFYTDVDSFVYRIGAFGPAGTVMNRLTSVGFDCPNLTTPVPQSVVREDFGDAPASYGNPAHTIPDAPEEVRLGATITDETGPNTSANASGDTGDDGVTLPNFLAGETRSVNVSVVNNTGRTGYLQAWIDWNRDGDFGDQNTGVVDTDEQIALNVQDPNADGIITLDITAPASAVAGTTIARLRWSTELDVSFQEAADDGEVEDYQITLTTPTPFACDGTLYHIGGNPSRLATLDVAPSGAGYTTAFTTIGTTTQLLRGAWGYNPEDDLIYGIVNATRELWRVDAAGQFTQVAGLGTNFRTGGTAGDILPGGKLVYRDNTTRWAQIDVTDPVNPVDDGDFTLTTALNVADFAYNPVDGRIYGVDNDTDRLFHVDAGGGPGPLTPTFFGPATFTDTYRAAWFDNAGNLYLHAGSADQLFMVDVGVDGSGTGVAVLLDNTPNDLARADGASCKIAPPIPLGAIAGTLYEDADEDNVFDAGEDTLPANISLAIYDDQGSAALGDDRLVRQIVTAADGTYLAASLLPVRSYRVDLDETDSDIVQTLQLGTPDPLTGLSVPANGTNGGNDFGFDILTPGLDGSKSVEAWDPTGTGTFNTPGSEVVYTLTVRNPGGVPTDADTIFLVDSLPPSVSFWNGDLEDGGADSIPGSDPVALVQSNGAALTFDFSSDFGVSTSPTPPTDFSQCTTTTPTNQHEGTVRHLCFRPRGSLAGGNPVPEVEIKFRALVR